MVYDVVYVIGLEFVEDRNNHCTVCNSGKKRYSPMRTVASADSNFIAFLNAALFKDNV